MPAASGGVKGKRSVRRGLQKTSLFQQAMFSQGTTSGKVDPPPVPIQKEKLHTFVWSFVLALPIFPGSRPPSIVGAGELNFCVRDGNRWTLTAINTNSVWMALAIFYINTLLSDDHFGDPYRIRTDVNGVRGRCLNHLTNGPWCTFRDSNPGPTD